MAAIVAAASALAGMLVGYQLRRLRPLRRFDDWMWRSDPARHSIGWWVQEVYALVVLALHPLRTVQALRLRRSERLGPVVWTGAIKPKMPAPEMDPNWATREDGSQ